MSSAIEPLTDGRRGFYTTFANMPIGRRLGGKCGNVVACPKCGRAAWKANERSYVHSSVTQLQPNNEPSTQPIEECRLTKNEAEKVKGDLAAMAKRGRL